MRRMPNQPNASLKAPMMIDPWVNFESILSLFIGLSNLECLVDLDLLLDLAC